MLSLDHYQDVILTTLYTTAHTGLPVVTGPATRRTIDAHPAEAEVRCSFRHPVGFTH